MLDDHRCPVDQRIEAYLNEHFADLNLDEPFSVPGRAMVLDRHGPARELSLPADGDEFENDLLHSYRVRNGVLHNPRSDRRTTVGTSHVCEGGLAIPGDKRAVPKRTFANLFQAAMNPPHDLMLVPFTANQPDKARYWMAVLLRPVVCPEVPGYCPETMLNGCSFLDTREPKQTQASVKWTGAGKSNSIAHCRANRGSQVPEHVQLSHNLLAE